MWSVIIINSKVVQQDNAFEGMCITKSNESEVKLDVQLITSYKVLINRAAGADRERKAMIY